eukprot:gene10897-11651_t
MFHTLALFTTIPVVASFGWHNTTKAPPSTSPVTLLDFSTKQDSYSWVETDDPVMGGQSAGTFTPTDNNTAIFQGTTKIVPFLKAPGFCKATTKGGSPFAPLEFPDCSHWINGAIHLTVRTSTPTYKGFKLAFGAQGAKAPTFHHGTPSFKSDFFLTSLEWTTLVLPVMGFSVDWSDYTGSCTTKDPNGQQHYCCSSEHPEVSFDRDNRDAIDPVCRLIAATQVILIPKTAPRLIT